jgi:hypothetical protein
MLEHEKISRAELTENATLPDGGAPSARQKALCRQTNR